LDVCFVPQADMSLIAILKTMGQILLFRRFALREKLWRLKRLFDAKPRHMAYAMMGGIIVGTVLPLLFLAGLVQNRPHAMLSRLDHRFPC
jgi:hypothetical protein